MQHRLSRGASLAWLLAAGCHGATGDGSPALAAPADGAQVADAADAPDEADGSGSCADTCSREGPACDPAGSNRLGTCARSASTGCFAVADLGPCPTGSPICVAGTSRCVMAGFVVDPHGDDSNPGTVAKPFATLRHARDVVRTLDAAMTGDIAVYLRAGDYSLARSDCTYGGSSAPSPAGLCFDERDSGTLGRTVRYANYDAVGSARLLGATAVSGWVPYEKGIWRAPWGGAPFEDLFENGVRAVKARSPDVNPRYGVSTTSQGPYFATLAPGTGIDASKQFRFTAADLPSTAWGAADGHVQVQIYSGGARFAGDTPNFNWYDDLDPVVGLDPTAGVVTLAQPTVYPIPQDSRYFVQGDLSLLNAPGEWHLGGGYLYYYPRNEPIASQEILAPQVKAILQFCPRFQPGELPLKTQGYLCGHGAQVHDVAIDGLTLQASDFLTEYPDRTASGADPSAMVYLEHTKAIAIEHCHLRNAGQNAIAMLYANDANVIDGNWIEDSGLSAIIVRTLASYTGQPASGGHRIRGNRVEFVGMHQSAQLGIHLEESGGNVVSHDTVTHGPRILLGGAIDAPAPALGNYYGYAALVSGSEDTADDAPFYFFGVCASSPCAATELDLLHMPPKIVEQLRVDGAAWDPSSQLVYPRSFPPWGFYLDNSSSHWTVRNVAVSHVATNPINGSVRLYNGGTDISESNVSWSPGFDEWLMDDDNIGLLPDFPPAFGNGGFTWIDDHASACKYSGSWVYRNDAAVAEDYAGDETYSNVSGDSVRCAFTGTEVRWVAATSNNRGVADVFLDGVPSGKVDLATPRATDQRVVYRRTGLAAGAHSLEIVVRDDRPAERNYVVVDAIGAK